MLKGCCCAEAIVRGALMLMGEESEALCAAAAGLCGGIRTGHDCGALSGGAMMLSLFDRGTAAQVMIPELVEWFDDRFGMEYGSVSCEDIAGEGLRYKAERCRPLTIAVYEKCVELLRDTGFL